MNLKPHEKRIFSQNGEDGIIEHLINILYESPNGKTFLEIGTEDGNQCNTKYIREKYQWNGTLIDAQFENLSINLHKFFVNRENILSILQDLSIPKKVELLSLDIDSNDFYVLHEILKEYEFDIIVCEYNVGFGPTEDKVVIYNPELKWDGTNYYGASLSSFTKLCNKFDYYLVGTDSIGVNAFFVSKKKLEDLKLMDSETNDVDKLYSVGRFGPGSYGGQPNDRTGRRLTSFDELFNL